MNVEDCLRAAFEALLRSDTEARDRYCDLAKNLMSAKDRLDKGYPAEEGIMTGAPICLPNRSKETQ